MTDPYPATASLTLTRFDRDGGLGVKLNEQRKRDEFCDYHFTIHGQTVAAHKAVLALASPYFDTMFKSQFLESNADTLDLSDVFTDKDELELVLSYMYENKIEINEDNLGTVLNGASHFLIDNLRSACGQYMTSNLGLQNVLRTWALAELYSLADVTPVCEDLVKARFHDYIACHSSALEVPKSFLVDIIKKGALKHSSVPTRAKFLINWTKHDMDERGDQLLVILSECSEYLNLILWKNHTKNAETAIKQLERIMAPPPKRTKSASKLYKHSGVCKNASNDVVVCVVKRRSRDYFSMPGAVMLYGYLPSRNEWLNLGNVNLFAGFYNGFRKLLGFAKDSAVYVVEGFPRKVALGKLKDSTFEVIDGPVPCTRARFSPGEESRHFFCFDDNIFCLILQKNKQRKKPKSRAKLAALAGNPALQKPQFVYRKAVYMYQGGKNWKMACELPLETEEPTESRTTTCAFVSHITNDEVFILGRIRVESYDLFSNSVKTVLLSFKKNKSAYTITQLTGPPQSFQDRMAGRSLKIRLVTTAENHLAIFLGRKSTYHKSPTLVYDKKKDRWREIAFANVDSINLISTLGYPTSKKVYTSGVCMKGVKNLYAVDVPAPFTSKLWFHDTRRGEEGWKTLPGPPTLHVYKLSVHNVSQALLDKCTPVDSFYDYTLEAARSPYCGTTYLGSNAGNCHEVSNESGDLPSSYGPSLPPYTYMNDSDSSSSAEYSDYSNYLEDETESEGSMSSEDLFFDFI